METLPAQVLFQRPHTPPVSVALSASESQVEIATPPWARNFEHLLGTSPLEGSPPKPALLHHTLLARPAAIAAGISKPPHLRKREQDLGSSIPLIATLGSEVDSLKEMNTSSVKTSPAALPISPFFGNVRRMSGSSNASYSKLAASFDETKANYTLQPKHAKPVHELEVQKALLESFIYDKPAPSSQAYERYLRAKLINIMEDEMDMETRTTCRGLNSMSEEECNAHFNKTKAMHKLSWDIKQRCDKISGTDVKASFAMFQQAEEEQFKQPKPFAGDRSQAE